MAKFWPQMAKFWPSHNFPGIYTMIFSKKSTRVVSIPKIIKFIAAFRRYKQKTLKIGYFGQKWPNFVHFWPFWGSKNFRPKNLWWSSKSYGDTTSCKKIEKILKGQGCRTGTHGCTNRPEGVRI